MMSEFINMLEEYRIPEVISAILEKHDSPNSVLGEFSRRCVDGQLCEFWQSREDVLNKLSVEAKESTTHPALYIADLAAKRVAAISAECGILDGESYAFGYDVGFAQARRKQKAILKNILENGFKTADTFKGGGDE
jgi:hypothetical protein